MQHEDILAQGSQDPQPEYREEDIPHSGLIILGAHQYLSAYSVKEFGDEQTKKLMHDIEAIQKQIK